MSNLQDEIGQLLEQSPGRRMAVWTLERRVRANGWKGFTLGMMGPMCEELGYQVYPGRNDRGRRVTWVSLDPPPEVELDEFSSHGFVLVDAENRFFDRRKPGGFDSRRFFARVWKSYGWAHRFAERRNLLGVAEVAATKRLG